MEIVGSILVELIDGPLDGESIILVAAGSAAGPPQQLCYLTSAKEQAAWLVYETEHYFVAKWPIQDVKIKYHYIGTYALGKGKILKTNLK